jgi:hypothetical protein
MKRIAALLVAVLLSGLALAPSVRADDVGSADRSAIQSLITGQIQAFRADDSQGAWAYASPTIQGLFQTPDNFMAMVRNGYQPVYRPRSVTFGELMATPSGPVQKVYLTGPDGKGYVAVYDMQRQADGTWKINGCQIVVDDAPSI